MGLPLRRPPGPVWPGSASLPEPAGTDDLQGLPAHQPCRPASPAGLPALLDCQPCPSCLRDMLGCEPYWPESPADLPAPLACHPRWPAIPACLPVPLVSQPSWLSSPACLTAPLACEARMTASPVGIHPSAALPGLPAAPSGLLACQSLRPASHAGLRGLSDLQPNLACLPCWAARSDLPALLAGLPALLACRPCCPAVPGGLRALMSCET